MIRPATLMDLDRLVTIEDACFTTDRLSRRSFRHLLTKGNAATLVEEVGGQIRGYVMLLFSNYTSLARLYSLAVDPGYQHKGVGLLLVEAAEQSALERECVSMRLEIRQDNSASIQLFQKMGYKQFDLIPGYYEDQMAALRFEKSLAHHLRLDQVHVPYYEQTLDFTCGPSALMMAMKAVDSSVTLNRTLELRLWRESTTIFMTAGHGGCGPFGLALSAYHRGFEVDVYVNEKGPFLVDSVRGQDKKEVVRLVHEDFLNEINTNHINVRNGALSVSELEESFASGGIPIVLISSYRIYHEKSPHWVVVTGVDERFIYVHDSSVDYEEGKSAWDCMNMPIHKKEFERMARYGKA
ncbi:MAG: GCN5-like N-acetyltransferase, partial [Halothiobacillaceae bacterium]